ncbi:MAG TPA: hypothetical protein PLE88_06785 [Anaerohalosphaeraceae bacterium]|nr:hypothetical protein [Anaerohalosphaeraceae bacterium]
MLNPEAQRYTTHLSLSQLISDAAGGRLQAEYADENLIRCRFCRQICNTPVLGTIDYLPHFGIFGVYISHRDQNNTLGIDFDFPGIRQAAGGLFLSEDAHLLIWTTDKAKLVIRDSSRIKDIQEQEIPVKTDNGRVTLQVPAYSADSTELALYVFTEQAADFLEQIRCLSEIEKRRITRAHWFYYSDWKDFWKYLLGGRFYNLRSPYPFESQLIHSTFYFYFGYLHQQTQKPLYAFLAFYVAYLTLLSLPEDDCWRHGIWQEQDSHYVHWIAGVMVFTDFYKRCRLDIFLDKSRRILDRCIALSDHCRDDTRWYLHDSLEAGGMLHLSPYKNHFASAAFGKSANCTLTLNTHISTLLAFKMFYDNTGDARYEDAYRKGFKRLGHVLQQRPASGRYAIVYGLRDLLTRALVGKNRIFLQSIIARYDHLLGQHILPRLKKKHPRLAMPNGFIERDLTFSFYNQFYHLLNTEHLLMIYSIEPSQWLKKLISRSVRYSLASKMVLYLARSDELALTFLGVLLQYGTQIDIGGLKSLEQYLLYFVGKGLALPAKILACPFISDCQSDIRTSNPKILVLKADKPLLNAAGLIVNLSAEKQHFTIESRHQTVYYLEDWNGRQQELSAAVSLAGLSSLKLCIRKMPNDNTAE